MTSGSRLTDEDLEAFARGAHATLYRKLGARLERDRERGTEGAHFAVWAPNAASVEVVGDFNDWAAGAAPMSRRGASGVWEALVAGAHEGQRYKYRLRDAEGAAWDKADPVGFLHQAPPETASILWGLEYAWGDRDWMAARGPKSALDAPMSVYEVHLGSWRRVLEDGGRSLTYRELAPVLIDHVLELGFTHVELLPLMEHPFTGSWGYQVTGYFASTHRFGVPQDLMYLIDRLHQSGIGVILDWVPAHFPNDPHGLARFDGTAIYEHPDPRRGFHPDWNSCIFDYGRPEVRSFLLSSAMFWLDVFHADALRVDGVASMLYLDYSRRDGEWIPNADGGHENWDAVHLLRAINDARSARFPDTRMIAEESTSWPLVTRSSEEGGLGFDLKWDMGWMHDTLRYLQQDPIHRAHHHEDITFRSLYAFQESYLLPLSHDEVVHGKGSLLGKMPGDSWQKLANLRLLYASLFAQPGKKLLFMGAELAQWREWDHDSSIDWHLLDEAPHAAVCRLVGDLNRLHRGEPAMHVLDTEPAGFSWIDGTDSERSVIAFLRLGRQGDRPILAALNYTPVVRYGYTLGVPMAGSWEEILNTDGERYGGSGVGNLGGVEASPEPAQGRPCSMTVTLPPLGGVFFRAPRGLR